MPPTALQRAEHLGPGVWEALTPARGSPLLVFVNSKSGDNQVCIAITPIRSTSFKRLAHARVTHKNSLLTSFVIIDQSDLLKFSKVHAYGMSLYPHEHNGPSGIRRPEGLVNISEAFRNKQLYNPQISL